jgi:hypothetical protein
VSARKPDGWPILVEALRDAADGIGEAARQTRNISVYFPPAEASEREPLRLEGYVPLTDVADLVRYIADMLEV